MTDIVLEILDAIRGYKSLRLTMFYMVAHSCVNRHGSTICLEMEGRQVIRQTYGFRHKAESMLDVQCTYPDL